MSPRLDKWIIYGNCLVGYVYDDPKFPPRTRVKTDAVVEVDTTALLARCVDGDYVLLEPGTESDHKDEDTKKIILL